MAWSMDHPCPVHDLVVVMLRVSGFVGQMVVCGVDQFSEIVVMIELARNSSRKLNTTV